MFSYGKFTTVSGEQRRKILFRTNYELGSVVLFCLFIGKYQKYTFYASVVTLVEQQARNE